MIIGEWNVKECLVGKFKLDGGAMFGVVPKTIWSKLIPADDLNRIPMALRTLLIIGNGKSILIDSGSGRGYGEKLERIYQFNEYKGVDKALLEAGLSRTDITDVIVSHLHFDHGGGLAEPDSGGWKLSFPNARHHVHAAQWDHALSPTARDRASYFEDRIEILQKEGALDLHDGPWSMDNGLDIEIVNGHTPGQQLPKISGGGKTLFFCGDLVPTASHLPVPYIMAYDLNPVLAMEEKLDYLDRAVDQEWILFFEHDPEIAACLVKKSGKRYLAAEPVKL